MFPLSDTVKFDEVCIMCVYNVKETGEIAVGLLPSDSLIVFNSVCYGSVGSDEFSKVMSLTLT